MKVIAISGRAQHGKDTIASMMKKQLDDGDTKILITHYADLLKYICKEFLGWDGKKDEDGRRLLQHVGTDLIRRKAPDFWVDFIISMLTFFKDRWDYVFIPDVRFENEISKLRQSGFDVIHIHVERPYFDDNLTGDLASHVSENGINDIESDFYIHNNGTLEDLNIKITEWIKENLAYADNE